jgi:exosome complex RNA-binding protein Rrp42 (RNase PH superfamily)
VLRFSTHIYTYTFSRAVVQLEGLRHVQIVENRLYWGFAVDVLVLRASGGNVLSCMSIAVKSALQNTR